MEIEIRLDKKDKEQLLLNGKAKLDISNKVILEQLINYNKKLKKVTKQLLAQIGGTLQLVYCDLDKQDSVMIVYKYGKYDGTDLTKYNYVFIPAKEILNLKRDINGKCQKR